MSQREDSQEYKQRRSFFNSLITLYGRNVVEEVLSDTTINIHKLHLSKSNKSDKKLDAMIKDALSRDIEIVYHDKSGLSRISKNAKQDQGIAIDVATTSYKSSDDIEKNYHDSYRLLALDGIQNPQNLGMIIRSAAAGNIDGIILPRKSSAKLSPLVMKASAGTLFKIDIFYCDTLETVFKNLDSDTKVYALSSHAKETIHTVKASKKSIFVLGNESDGVTPEVIKQCNSSLSIPMNRGVESLNVAVTASLIAFMK